MRKIYKYSIFRFSRQYVELPIKYRILKFGNQHNDMFIWVEVDTVNPMIEKVEFNIVGTGHTVSVDGEYIDTVILPDGMVWHLYRQFAKN